MHDILHFEKFNLRCAAQSLDSNREAERVTLSHELLEVLEKDEEKDFHNVLTRDKF
jgi:hypothetical protein